MCAQHPITHQQSETTMSRATYFTQLHELTRSEQRAAELDRRMYAIHHPAPELVAVTRDPRSARDRALDRATEAAR